MKNFLLKTFVKLFKKKTNPPSERFLIVSTTGLGDTLWATPAIAALREKYPHAHIAVLTNRLGKTVLETNPYINALYVLKLALFFTLRKQRFHKIFIFHISQRITLPLCALFGAEEIIGTQGQQKGLDSLLTKCLPKKYQHEVNRRLEIVGLKKDNPRLTFFVDQKIQNEINSFLEPYKGPFIGMHPGAKDKFKQWDPACFIKVGNMLKQKSPCTLFITGNKEEEKLCSHIASQIEGAISVAGKFNLQQSAALISRFSAMVANDTGPMHLAFALNTPTVALFTPTDPKLCGPLYTDPFAIVESRKLSRSSDPNYWSCLGIPKTNAIVVEKQKTCTPCIRKNCTEPFCLLQISPQEVYNALLELL